MKSGVDLEIITYESPFTLQNVSKLLEMPWGVWHTKITTGPWHSKTPVFASIVSFVLWGQYWVQEAGRAQWAWKVPPPSGDQKTPEQFLLWEQYVLPYSEPRRLQEGSSTQTLGERGSSGSK